MCKLKRLTISGVLNSESVNDEYISVNSISDLLDKEIKEAELNYDGVPQSMNEIDTLERIKDKIGLKVDDHFLVDLPVGNNLEYNGNCPIKITLGPFSITVSGDIGIIENINLEACGQKSEVIMNQRNIKDEEHTHGVVKGGKTGAPK